MRHNATANKNNRMDIPAEKGFSNVVPPTWRPPERADYLWFFLGIPAGIGLLFSLVGTRLTNGMPYADALVYMVLHMFVAWWVVSLGAFSARIVCRSWRPPVVALCVMGFVISIVPAVITFRTLGEVFAGIYPIFAANRSHQALPSWSFEYLSHFLRYSIPALPLFLAGVYGFRALRNVDLLGYEADGVSRDVSDLAATLSAEPVAAFPAQVALLEGATLPPDAEVIAIKAEQHYIQIWSSQGKELLRFRFRDVPVRFEKCAGEQVHRSWWVNFGHVRQARKAGRSIELHLSNDLVVPVSLANRNTVLKALEVGDADVAID